MNIYTYILLMGMLLLTQTIAAQPCRYLYEEMRKSQNEIQKIEVYGECLRQNKSDDSLFLYYYDAKTVAFLKSNQLDSAEYLISLSMAICENAQLAHRKTVVDFTQALLNLKKKEYIKAIQGFKQILPEAQKNKDVVLESKIWHNLAIIYIELYQHEASIDYIENAMRLVKMTPDFLTQGKIAMQLGDLYMYVGKLEQAEKTFRDAVFAFQKAQLPDYQGNAAIHVVMAQQKQQKRIQNETLDSLLASISVIRNGNAGKITKSTAYVWLAKLLIYQNVHLDSANALLQEALPVCRDMRLRINLTDIYEAYTEWYKIKNDPPKVYQYISLYIQQKEEITQEGSRLQLNGLRVLHEVEQQEQQIKELQQKQQIAQLWNVIMIICLFFVICSGIVFWFFLRQKLSLSQEKLKNQALLLENQNLLTQKLEAENAQKTRELASNTLHILQKNEVLEKLNAEISPLLQEKELSEQIRQQLQNLRGSIRENDFWEQNWEHFRKHFEQIHPEFFEKLKKSYPGLTANELRHCAYIRMQLSRKEVAMLMNVGVEAVKMARIRLKKKMNLKESDDLYGFLMTF